MLNTRFDYIEKKLVENSYHIYEFTINGKLYVLEVVAGSTYLRVTLNLAGKGTGISNTGDAFQVFSSVFHILSDVRHLFNKKIISFNSHLCLPSRVKLYDRFCHFLSRKGLASYSFDDDSRYREYEICFH